MHERSERLNAFCIQRFRHDFVALQRNGSHYLTTSTSFAVFIIIFVPCTLLLLRLACLLPPLLMMKVLQERQTEALLRWWCHQQQQQRSDRGILNHSLIFFHSSTTITKHLATTLPFSNELSFLAPSSWLKRTTMMLLQLSVSFFLERAHRSLKFIFVSLTIHRSFFLLDDEHSFVMHRKLLRRRHVRKVQKDQRLKRQREADSRKRRNPTVEGIQSVIRPVNSFSKLDGAIGDISTCSNASGQTVNQHVAMIRNTICSSNRGVLIEHNKDTGVTEKNAGSAFTSTPLPYSPLRSTKRRRLFVSSSCCWERGETHGVIILHTQTTNFLLNVLCVWSSRQTNPAFVHSNQSTLRLADKLRSKNYS